MRLILIRETDDSVKTGVLQQALSMAPLAGVIVSGASRLRFSVEDVGGGSKSAGRTFPEHPAWIVPGAWRGHLAASGGRTVAFAGTAEALHLQNLEEIRSRPWLVISDGRFATHVAAEVLEQVLAETDADVIAVTASPRLLAYREHVRLTQHGELVGYRRLFRDSAEPAPIPSDWPHHLFVRTERLDRVFGEGLPSRFDALIERCRSHHLNFEAVGIAGSVVDMESAGGLLAFSRAILTRMWPLRETSRVAHGRQTFLRGRMGQVSSRARFVGPVLLGDHVCVEPDAVIIGPTILCDDSTVRQGAVVDSSILGAKTVVDREQILREAFITASETGPESGRGAFVRAGQATSEFVCPPRRSAFRTWPVFSYARCWKRIADVIAATIVLVLFAPVIPFIALAIKVNSRGPVFFKDRRQGYRGRFFNCVKFRTMRVGAAEIQDKLRFVCEVDGPQFKMADDPRISTVGRFLRETYLDEIPQFFNVLIGDMSIVGPRPSPESENTQCPWWRDARLSVRPGISGLWQVCRTRQPFKDFQEWIYFDTKYVQELSPQMDLWVCWCTFRKMVDNFIRQF